MNKAIESRGSWKKNFFRKVSLSIWSEPTTPNTYGRFELKFDNALKFLEEYNTKNHSKINVTHLMIKALGLGMKANPDCNLELTKSGFRHKNTVDITVMVHVPPKNGQKLYDDLSLLKIENTDSISLQEISQCFSKDVHRVKSKTDSQLKWIYKLTLGLPVFLTRFLLKLYNFIDYDLNLSLEVFKLPRKPFGSFVFSNVGTFDLEEAWAPLVPMARMPFIVTLGKIIPRPLVENNQIIIAKTATLCATLDHRYFDGAQAARIIKKVSEVLENPHQHLT